MLHRLFTEEECQSESSNANKQDAASATKPSTSTPKIPIPIRSPPEEQKRFPKDDPKAVLPSSKAMLAKLNVLQDRKSKPKKISFSISAARNVDAKHLLTCNDGEDAEAAKTEEEAKEKTKPQFDKETVKERLEKLKSKLDPQSHQVSEKTTSDAHQGKKSMLQRMYENSADDFSIERLAPSDQEFEKRKRAKTEEDRMEEVEDSLIRRAEEFLKHKKSNTSFLDDYHRSGRVPVPQQQQTDGNGAKQEAGSGAKRKDSRPPAKFVDETISVVSVLRLLTALEEKLGSMGENVSSDFSDVAKHNLI